MSDDQTQEDQLRQKSLEQRLNSLSISPTLGEPSSLPQAFFGSRSKMIIPNAQTLGSLQKKKVVDRSESYDEALKAIEQVVEAKGKLNIRSIVPVAHTCNSCDHYRRFQK